MHRYISVALLGLFLFSGLGFAKSLPLENANTKVEFLAVGNPSAIKIKGKAEPGAVKGQLNIAGDKVTGTAICKLETLDTGIDTRNKHMKEKYLETAKFPDAKLEITKLLANLNADEATIEGSPFEGFLDLHGVKRAITGTADFQKKGNTVKSDFTFKLKVSDYAIALPTFMGVTMTDEVTVKVATESDLL